MGASSSCQTHKFCQEREIQGGSVFNSITINAIVDSSECIPFEARTLQLYKSQKSHFHSKENEFEKQRIGEYSCQNPSIKILDQDENIQNQNNQLISLKKCIFCQLTYLNEQEYIIECNDSYHRECFTQHIRLQILNGDCKLFCNCGQKIHTIHARNNIDKDLLEKLYSNQLGIIYKNNQNILQFNNNHKYQIKEDCFHCQKQLISQKIQLQCKHSLHKYCLKDLCNQQIEKDQSYLICFCGAQIQTQLLRQLKSDSFKQILQKLFRNQLIQLYNTSQILQKQYHFKIFIKAVNSHDIQKQSSYSLRQE